MIADQPHKYLTSLSIENYQTNIKIYYTGSISNTEKILWYTGSISGPEKILWTRGDYDFRRLVVDETGVITHDHYDHRF